jgi:hypothetical protein
LYQLAYLTFNDTLVREHAIHTFARQHEVKNNYTFSQIQTFLYVFVYLLKNNSVFERRFFSQSVFSSVAEYLVFVTLNLFVKPSVRRCHFCRLVFTKTIRETRNDWFQQQFLYDFSLWYRVIPGESTRSYRKYRNKEVVNEWVKFSGKVKKGCVIILDDNIQW